MIHTGINGVPDFYVSNFSPKRTKYCLCIPVINEGERILSELQRIRNANVHLLTDVLICDGGSDDGSMEESRLQELGVNTLLVKKGPGKQGAQLRMGFWWALQRGYQGVVTVDGNDKDSVESVPDFVECLKNGYDFIQGSRFIKGGRAINTPLIRYLAVRFIHAPLISLAAGKWFTDTTNAFRGYSHRYLEHPKVLPFRDVFSEYELLAYLSVRATQLGLKVCEIPVVRAYPQHKKVPTKISPGRGYLKLLKVLYSVIRGEYNT